MSVTETVLTSPHAAKRWRYAAKPTSWPKLLVPTLFGQLVGVALCDGFSFGAALFGVFFGFSDLMTIVFLNDWADRRVDTIKREMFPETCSPKTIPDGILPARSLAIAGVLGALACVVIAWISAWLLERPYLLPGGVLALLIFWAYTLPPIRMNYRGGGEGLEALGVAVVLPWLNAYAQSGVIFAAEYIFSLPLLVLSLASAIASGLADERSDLRGGKKTVVTRLGNTVSRKTIEILSVLAALAWIGVGAVIGNTLAGLAGAGAVLVWLRPLRSISFRAQTDAFSHQKRYKQLLHRAVWWSALAASSVLVLRPVDTLGSYW